MSDLEAQAGCRETKWSCRNLRLLTAFHFAQLFVCFTLNTEGSDTEYFRIYFKLGTLRISTELMDSSLCGKLCHAV